MEKTHADPSPIGTFWMLDLASSSAISVAPHIPAVFQQIDSWEVSSLAQAMGVDEAAVLQRMSRGCRCYVAKVKDVLAAYGWVTLEDKEEIGELGLSFYLAKGNAYIWDCGTLPAYRGQRLYPALLAVMVEALRAGGFVRVWVGADTDNVASQRGIVLAGFQPIADIVIDAGSTARPLQLRGCPGTPLHLVMDVSRALFNE